MGQEPTPGLVIKLEEWAAQLHPDVVEYAIMEASLAPRPSWAYVQGILNKCKGIPYCPIEGVPIETAVRIARERKEASQ